METLFQMYHKNQLHHCFTIYILNDINTIIQRHKFDEVIKEFNHIHVPIDYEEYFIIPLKSGHNILIRIYNIDYYERSIQ